MKMSKYQTLSFPVHIKNLIKVLFVAFTLSMSSNSLAAIETYSFNNAQQEQDYKILINELRCMVCQNQNLADSNAELAQDLRRQVHKLLVEDEFNRKQVVGYMVERYGDFVLYNPPIKNYTYLLWLGPFIFLIIGLWFAISIIRKANQDNQKSLNQD